MPFPILGVSRRRTGAFAAMAAVWMMPAGCSTSPSVRIVNSTASTVAGRLQIPALICVGFPEAARRQAILLHPGEARVYGYGRDSARVENWRAVVYLALRKNDGSWSVLSSPIERPSGLELSIADNDGGDLEIRGAPRNSFIQAAADDSALSSIMGELARYRE